MSRPDPSAAEDAPSTAPSTATPTAPSASASPAATSAPDPDGLDAPLLRLIVVLVSGAVLALVNTTVIGIALPAIGRELGADLAATSGAGNAYILALAVAIGLSGWSSIRFGLRRTWLVALVVFAAGSLLAALAPTIAVVIGGRVLQGIGGGMLEPVMLTAIAKAAGPSRMGRAMAIVAGVIALGPLLGPLAGGALVELLDWRWLFAAFVPLALISFAASARLLPREQGSPVPLDLRGLVLISTGLIGTLLMLTRIAQAQTVDRTGLAAGTAGALLLIGYVHHARRRGTAALAPLAPLAVPGAAAAVGTLFLLGAAIYPLFYGLPMFFQDTRGQGALAAGLLLAPHGSGALLGLVLGSRMSDARDPRILAACGGTAIAAGAIGYIALGSQAPLWSYLIASFVTGAGTGFVGGPAMASLYRVLPPHLIPAGSTLVFILNQVGGAVGIALMTVVIASGDPSGWTLAVGTAPMWIPTIGALLILALARSLPGPPTTTGTAPPAVTRLRSG